MYFSAKIYVTISHWHHRALTRDRNICFIESSQKLSRKYYKSLTLSWILNVEKMFHCWINWIQEIQSCESIADSVKVSLSIIIVMNLTVVLCFTLFHLLNELHCSNASACILTRFWISQHFGGKHVFFLFIEKLCCDVSSSTFVECQ